MVYQRPNFKTDSHAPKSSIPSQLWKISANGLLTTIEWIHLIIDVTIPETPKIDMANVDKFLWYENSPAPSDASYDISTISSIELLSPKTLKVDLAPGKTEEGVPDAREWLEVSDEHREALEHIGDMLLTAVQRFLLHLASKINSEHCALLSRLKDDVNRIKGKVAYMRPLK